MSVQLAQYLQARADGSSVEEACALSTIGIGEARLHEKDIERGEMTLPPPRARAGAREGSRYETEEKLMARDNETTVDTGEVLEFDANTIRAQSVAADELRLFIERIERLSEERKGIADDISDVYSEAKAQGYDKPTMRRIVRLRAMDPQSRQEAAALLETYADALGLQGALPL